MFKRPKLTTQQVGSAGEHFVAAEIHRRGGYAVTFSGDMHDIDLLASDARHDRVISIQVKTKTASTWQTSTKRGKKRRAPEVETKYWVLIDLGKEHPGFVLDGPPAHEMRSPLGDVVEPNVASAFAVQRGFGMEPPPPRRGD